MSSKIQKVTFCIFNNKANSTNIMKLFLNVYKTVQGVGWKVGVDLYTVTMQFHTLGTRVQMLSFEKKKRKKVAEHSSNSSPGLAQGNCFEHCIIYAYKLFRNIDYNNYTNFWY